MAQDAISGSDHSCTGHLHLYCKYHMTRKPTSYNLFSARNGIVRSLVGLDNKLTCLRKTLTLRKCATSIITFPQRTIFIPDQGAEESTLLRAKTFLTL